ncbi:MAG: hypothetical protein IK068_03825 [Lachnospiraceae bacterium]|nr:hypothetical protein [Lachnospiraceae bacterium]
MKNLLERITTFYKDKYTKIREKLAPYEKNIIIPLCKIILIIIVCVIIARVMGGNETLAEYAAKNGK